jgi:N-carbamoyl-L-amino-acid hydrolase
LRERTDHRRRPGHRPRKRHPHGRRASQCGVEIDRFPEATKEQKNAAAYIELHIEQGPVLERLGLPLGVVLGTKGVERHAITFHGQEAHSGSTPMNARRDALAAAAKLALEIRAIAGAHPDAVCTMGSVKTFPGIVTAVVGRCEATLDQRDLDAQVLAAMYAKPAKPANALPAKKNARWNGPASGTSSRLPFTPRSSNCAPKRSKKPAPCSHRMPSGPLHDAAEVARAGIPSVMMFVQSLGGISHNKIEDTREEHLELAVTALDRLASDTAHWIATGNK